MNHPTLWVRNRGETAWTGGEATLTLPAGLVLAGGESTTKTLGDVPAGDARSASWHLWAYSAQIISAEFAWRSEMSHPDRILTYSAQITFAEGGPLTAEGTVSVPACHTTPTPTATTTPTATATTTVTLTPTATGTPEAGREWEVYLPLLRRGPQPLPDLTGTGGTSIVLRRVPPSPPRVPQKALHSGLPVSPLFELARLNSRRE